MLSLIQAAIGRRQQWIADGDTDSYRLFHGIAEGAPGVTIDRYGSEIVVQVSRDGELSDQPWNTIAEMLLDSQDVSAVQAEHRLRKCVLAVAGDVSRRSKCREGTLQFWNSLGRPGADPWFYLDFRSARRFVRDHSLNKRVANFFSYTGTAGIVAASAGAMAVSNIDVGRWCSDVAKENGQLNQVETRIIKDDFFSVARQWAGGQAKNRKRGGRGKRGPVYEAESFDLVILDPPTQTSGPNGAVDINRDYPSLAKPCMQMLAPGGWLLCSHHHAGKHFDEWQAIVERTATKIGRRILATKRIAPDADFPIVGEEPLLKVLALQLS